MDKMAVCMKVPRKQGQEAIALANQLGVLDKSLLIKRDQEDICIPLARQLEESEVATLKSRFAQYRLETLVFAQKQPTAGTVMQALKGKLPPDLQASLPQALDVVGDIAIIEIPAKLKPYQNLIGQSILRIHKNVKTVLAKAGSINGIFRLRKLTFIAGEEKTQTIHKEFGCQFHVDVAKTYFSPRLSHEHMRVASLVQADETVVDLFAGVGPFSVLIGKRNSSVRVYAIDINPKAVELLKVNVRVNRVENKVFPVLADAKQITATELRGSADRVIMNLPETALDFVDAACQAIKPEGGIIHFYAFIRSPDSTEKQRQQFSEAVEKAGRKCEGVLCAKNVRETAPYEFQVVLDAKIA